MQQEMTANVYETGSRRIKVSSQLAGGIPKEIVERVSDALKSIGYLPRNEDGYLDS
jgi:hypothetical protein